MRKVAKQGGNAVPRHLLKNGKF